MSIWRFTINSAMSEKLEVLISCMHQDGTGIAGQTGVRTDALIVNQCPGETPPRKKTKQETALSLPEGGQVRIRMLTTPEKGLSRSRNLALRCAEGDIALICDDDEKLAPDYDRTILRAYRDIPDADLIVFRISNLPSRLRQERQRLNRWTAMRVSSCQITFRPDRVRGKRVRFDVNLGAGTGNGGGEEVMFLRSCIAAGLKVYFVPEVIGSLASSDSTWFQGRTREFFYQRGITNRYMLGLPVAVLYAVYYTVVKYHEYCGETSVRDALWYTLKGIFANDIAKQRRKKR